MPRRDPREDGADVPPRKWHRHPFSSASVASLPPAKGAANAEQLRIDRRCVDVAVLLTAIADVATMRLLVMLGGQSLRFVDVDAQAAQRLVVNDLAVVDEERGVLCFTPLGLSVWLSVRGLIV